MLLVILVSICLLIINVYLNKTEIKPQVGGQYKEGVLGQPRFINPILAQTNDADRDLVQLIYSGLFKYNNQGELIHDLAQSYTISDDGLNYEIRLKENLVWHDQEPLTADDVIFTIKTIQNPEYKSPLKNNWQGVLIEKIDDFTIKFKLNNIYAPFLHNLTVGIVPKHLWAGISAQNFPLAQYNLKPIGSGPYKFKEFTQNKEGQIELIKLVSNESFYQVPFIEKITLKFYKNQTDLINAYKRGQIDGLNFLSAANLSEIASDFKIHQINLPAYYAIFFNQTESKALSDKAVRLALSYATNKQEIIENVLAGYGQKVDSPLLPGWFGYNSEIKTYDFSLEQAQIILQEADWKDSNEDGIKEKTINDQETDLEITILTTDWPELEQTAQLLKAQWEKIGARVNLETTDISTIQQDFIRPRQYQALLFGEVLGADPDPFAFWHSSQKKDPGLNLSLYQNKKVDKLLEETRQTSDHQIRIDKYNEFQELLVEDIPAIFLYSPIYLYPVDKKVKGINIQKLAIPSQRFSQVENWYIRIDRVWK